MDPPLQLLLLGLLCAGVVWSRTVRVPKGPILRVVGTEVTLPCNVSDYEGPSEQNFEWVFSLAGGSPLGVISSWDSTFTDPSYAGRVKAGGIQLQRLGNSIVRLRIRELRASDEGHYTCSTPSTDATFSGNYEDRVQLRVIPDTLQLSGSRSRLARVQNVTEGGTFQLQCHTSSSDSYTEHTHLSLTWEYQRAGESPVEVLTLSQLARLQPGSGYEGRYRSGEARLDTVGADGYRLTMGGAKLSDAGEYSCVARTWVQGHEGWDQIQEKRVPVTRVEVWPVGLSVTVPQTAVSVPEGGPLVLSCVVSQDSDGPVLTRVRWFLSPTLGETREVTGGQDPDPGQDGAGMHRLEVPHTWDGGDYQCQATVWAQHSNGTWYPAAEKMSAPIRVHLTSSVPEFAVSVEALLTPRFSEEPTELACHVTGSGAARLSVSWYYSPALRQDAPAAPAQLLGSLDPDGSLRAGDGYRQQLEKGQLIFPRRGPLTFALRIQWTSEGDRGDYRCTVAAWERLRNDSWAQSREVTSAPVRVFWVGEVSSLAVRATQVKLVSASGGTFEMRCAVTAQHIPSPRYSVQLTAERPLPNPPGAAPVISLSRDGVTLRAQDSGGDTVLEKEEEGVYLFRLYRAQAQDAGAYSCSVTAWTLGGGGAWRETQNQKSNQLQLGFQTSGPLFNVTAQSDSPSVYRSERAELWCIIIIDGPAVDPEDMAFEVSWFSQRLAGAPLLLAAVDRAAQVRQSRRNGTSEVALERVSAMEFRLRIYGCEEQDAGGHYCVVTPWVRSGEGGWNRQEGITSNMVSLSVRMDMLSTFRLPLLIGAGLALLVGLIACLIGYCTSHFCCKAARPLQETRKEHRRLMSMEMD